MTSLCTVVINTCLGFHRATVPLLLESLDRAGVPKDAIRVVVGECEEDRDACENGVWHHYRRWCNIDNNGILWLTQESGEVAPWVVYLHDTSLVEPETFWSDCQTIVSERFPHADCIRLHHPFSMGMGFYRTEWLRSEPVRRYMEGFMCYDPTKKIDIKQRLDVLEDTLFKFAEAGRGECATLDNIYKIVEYGRTMYGTDIPRIVEFYRHPGIYKIKANWDPEMLHVKL
jgi:hypothetical protein